MVFKIEVFNDSSSNCLVDFEDPEQLNGSGGLEICVQRNLLREENPGSVIIEG